MSAADAAADAAAQAAAAEPPASTTPPAADAADAAAAAGVAELASLDLGDDAAGDEGDAAGASAATKAEAAAHRDAAIVKQVEFYFSDANLPTDEFLLGKIRGNKSGWGAPLPPQRSAAANCIPRSQPARNAQRPDACRCAQRATTALCVPCAPPQAAHRACARPLSQPSLTTLLPQCLCTRSCASTR
jgi:hypothetical protein